MRDINFRKYAEGYSADFQNRNGDGSKRHYYKKSEVNDTALRLGWDSADAEVPGEQRTVAEMLIANQAVGPTYKHTPGPWERHGNILVSPKASCVVVRLPAQTDRVGDESPEQIDRWDADARLIAAAPDLLSALEALTMYDAALPYGLGIDHLIDDAEAAIAKAKGEE